MGVPKFYRWISERYPCLSQVVKDHQIPEFDNLYLDMNGIIHPCSHPNDDDPHFRKTEGEIFEDIFHYIEVLFRIIKPKKVFFMAVDGVAPRAKMNQQRGRRFRSAREAEDNIRRALEKGQILPKEDRFDSNCITPGTPFMVRLHKQLKYFVNLKITTDPAWQGIRVYLSGHETPGEGEHKIMEFIRSEKSKPLYDSNTRHCLYGLDADLIMLGLTSHEPHFALLREEVKFGKAAKRISKPEEITFHLLHLTLLREYLDWEFSSLKEQLSFPYDLEKVIDDWILMGFLVGNDFIPHLPHLHINHDSLPYLWKVYKELMPSLDGYLHDGGYLSCPRFEKYMAALSKFDREKFEEVYVDLKWLESKSGMENGIDSGKTKPQADNENQDSPIASENSFSALDATTSRLKQLKLDSRARRLLPGTKAERRKELEKYIKEMGMHDEEDGNTFEIEFHLNKNHYYKEKMGYEVVDGEVFAEQTLEYVKGIQWILHYYFNGVQSWGWYYPFHYAPYMTDIKNFSEMTFDFEMGKPFMPFEQLLAVLPAASRKLLPEPFQNLMIMEQSPIIDYYPVSFETDLNGKQQEWEAVVLIPFIDEKRLLEAMKPLYSRLTEEEKGRNRHSPALLYTYNPELSFFYASTLPDTFSDIQCSHASCEEVPREAFHVDIAVLKKGLCEGVKLDVYFPGFPTMFHIPHTGQLKKANVKVFMMHSRSNSLMLKITEQPQQPTILVAKELLGETCYVGWPHMVEALVISICDNTFRYELDMHHPESRHGEKNVKQNILNEKQLDVWNFQRCSLIDTLKERRGIEVGEVNVLVEACPIQGKRYICGQKGQVTLEKQWAAHPVPHALQTVVKDISVFQSESNEKMETIEDLFPVDCQCFMLANPHYGCSGKVLEVDMKQGRVRVQLTVPPEPDIASISKMHHKLSANYLPSFVLAKKLGITEGMLARMTGKLIIERGSSTDAGDGGKDKVDIGLNFKFSKQNKEVLGCARRTENGWTYSPTAVKTISQYLNKFPEMFEALSTINAERIFEDDVLFHDASSDSSKLEDVKDWLKSLPSHGLEAVTCGSTSLDEPVVEAIENAVNEVKASERCTKTVKVRVRPYVLFRIHDHLGNVVPDPDADYQLFDRVVHVNMNATVPFGLRGTIIGIHEGHSESLLYETVFDETFLGGQALRCSSHRVSLVPPSSLINITYGERMEGKRRGTPVQSRIQTRVHASDESPGDSLQWTDRKVPFTPDFGTSPVFNHSGNVSRESLDLRFQSPGTHGKGRGFSPSQSPYGGGFGSPRFQTSSWTNVTPQGSQFRVSPNSAFSRSQHSTPIGQIYGTPPSQPGSAHNRGSDRKQNVPPRFQKNADKTPSGCSNSEFANMWKELKSKENSQLESTPVTTGSGILDENQPLVVEEFSSKTNSADPDDEQRETKEFPNTSIQESTKALRELLQIGSKPSVQKKNNASPQVAVPSSTTHSPMREALPAQEVFSRKGESTNFHVSPSPLPTTANGPYPSLILTNWCVATGLYPPSFLYTNSNKGVSAIVQLGNGIRFSGSVCRDQTEACESAAAVALSQMPRVMPHLAGPTGMLPISMFPCGQQFPPPPRLQHMSPHSPQSATLHPGSQAMHGGMTRTPAATRNGPVPRSQQATMTPNSPDRVSRGREQSNSAQALFVPMQVTRNINTQSPVKSPSTKQLDAEHSGDKTSKEQEKDEYHERERENSTHDKCTELDFSNKEKEISKSVDKQTSRKTSKKPQYRLAPTFLSK